LNKYNLNTTEKLSVSEALDRIDFIGAGVYYVEVHQKGYRGKIINIELENDNRVILFAEHDRNFFEEFELNEGGIITWKNGSNWIIIPKDAEIRNNVERKCMWCESACKNEEPCEFFESIWDSVEFG